MIRISYRDIDQEYNLSPEESQLKEVLLEGVSMTSINDAYSEFIRSVDSYVSDAIENHVEGIIKNNESFKKVQEINQAWGKLTPEQQRGPEGNRLSNLGAEADEDLNYLKSRTSKGLEKIKSAMISQIISWKVD